MKKSEKYKFAMMAVVDSGFMNASVKLEVLELLMAEKTMAEYCEKMEDEKNG